MPVVTDQIFHFCRYKVYKRAWQHIKCFSHNKKQEILVYYVVIITQNPDITTSFLVNACTHTDYAETDCRTRGEQQEVKCHVFLLCMSVMALFERTLTHNDNCLSHFFLFLRSHLPPTTLKYFKSSSHSHFDFTSF